MNITLPFTTFCLAHLKSARTPGTRLYNILDKYNRTARVSAPDLSYLEQNGFKSLAALLSGQISLAKYTELEVEMRENQNRYIETITLEQENRKREVEAHQVQKAKAIEEYRIKAKVRKETHLEYRYKLFDIHSQHKARIQTILKNLDGGRRIQATDVEFLQKNKYITDEIWVRYHFCEGLFFEREYEHTKSPWSAINGCGHFRKARLINRAFDLINKIKPKNNWQPKLTSAYLVVRGALYRSKGSLSKALIDALDAHTLQPMNHQPCTLLGAIYIEQGDYDLGESWFAKAIVRGASEYEIYRERQKSLHAKKN